MPLHFWKDDLSLYKVTLLTKLVLTDVESWFRHTLVFEYSFPKASNCFVVVVVLNNGLLSTSSMKYKMVLPQVVFLLSISISLWVSRCAISWYLRFIKYGETIKYMCRDQLESVREILNVLWCNSGWRWVEKANWKAARIG